MEFVIPSDLTEARHLQELIESQLQQSDYDDKEIFGIRLAFEEAVVNAIKHGNQMDRRKSVQVCYRILADRFEATITDEGPGYNPTDLPDPRAEERAQHRQHIGEDYDRAEGEEEPDEHDEESDDAEDPGQGCIVVLRFLEHLRCAVLAFLNQEDRIACLGIERCEGCCGLNTYQADIGWLDDLE